MTIDQEILKQSIRMNKERAVNLIAGYREKYPELNTIMQAQETGRCAHASSGCNSPEGECLGLCMARAVHPGAKLIDRRTREVFHITAVEDGAILYRGKTGGGFVMASELHDIFEVQK